MKEIHCKVSFRFVPLLAFLVSSASGLRAETFIVRPLPSSGLTAQASIGGAAVGERHCTEDRCIIIADKATQIAMLGTLESKGLVSVQAFPEARNVYFGGAIWDGETQNFDRDFPGKAELPSNSPESLFAVVFKSFPEAGWLVALRSAGFLVTEPLPTMAYLVYGDRLALQRFAAKAPYIYRVVEIPSGLRRSNLDTYLPDDGDEPASTLIAFANVSSSPVKKMLVGARGGEPPIEYVMNGIIAHSATLDRATALYVSRFPEVVNVTRQTFKTGLSDERSNRIIAGDWQTPGNSWPATLGPNTQLGSPLRWYWEDYLSHLSLLGLNLSRQTIGFLDTGVESGLSPSCPPHLWDSSAGRCRLTFTTDVTVDFLDPNLRAIDRAAHGTLTSSVAAGFVTDQVLGRDADPPAGGYAFTQGVAQGANVAMTKFFGTDPDACDHSYRQVVSGGIEPLFSRDPLPKVRYAIVMMNGTNPLPATEFAGSPAGPGASIFNHSWYSAPVHPYEAVSILLDQTTRNPRAATFDFGSPTPGTSKPYYGSGDPILHVVAAGNCATWDYAHNNWMICNDALRAVSTPGLAKNAITVGATQTYNQLPDTLSGTSLYCQEWNDTSHANNPRVVAPFSRVSPDPGTGPFRYKPELVAPGIRSYGFSSSNYAPDPQGWCFLCNVNLTTPLQRPYYAWSNGTSFAAPAVAGAAALVRDWLRVLNGTGHFLDPWVSPSPALVKATLIASARLLAGTGAPDTSQGFGGLSLDSLFRSMGNYFFFDQRFILPNQGNYAWEKTLTVNPDADVSIALVWTDRASVEGTGGLVNDLDLKVYTGAGQNYWIGNTFAGSYSELSPASPVFDSVNTAEKVLIRPSDLGGATQITIRVSAFSLTAGIEVPKITHDALNPDLSVDLRPRQDFALAVINAHE